MDNQVYIIIRRNKKMMTRKHYKAIAEILNKNLIFLPRDFDLVNDLANFFKSDNSRFNKIKFLEASGFVRKDVMLGHDSDPRFGDVLK